MVQLSVLLQVKKSLKITTVNVVNDATKRGVKFIKKCKDILTESTFQQNLILHWFEKSLKEKLDFKNTNFALSKPFARLH